MTNIVIGLFTKWRCCRIFRSICLFNIKGGPFLRVVEWVAAAGGEGGGGVAEGLTVLCFVDTVVEIGVEVDAGAVALVGKISLVDSVGGDALLQAKGIDDTHWHVSLGGHFPGTVWIFAIEEDGVAAQGQHAGRDFDGKGLLAVVFGDFDDDVFDIGIGINGVIDCTCEGVGRFVVGRCHFFLSEFIVVKDDALHIFNSHVLTEGIGEGDVAAGFRTSTFWNVGRCFGAADDFRSDFLEGIGEGVGVVGVVEGVGVLQGGWDDIAISICGGVKGHTIHLW